MDGNGLRMDIERRTDGRVVLRPREDRIDGAVSLDLRRAALAEIEAGCRAMTIDLSAVDFMDSSGLAVLVSIHKRLAGQGGLDLVGLGPRLRRLFELTRLDQVFRLPAAE